MANANLNVKVNADAKAAIKQVNIFGDVVNEVAKKNKESLYEFAKGFSPVFLLITKLTELANAGIEKIKEAMFGWKDATKKLAEAAEQTASKLKTTTSEASRLNAAARAAGVSAKEYEAALDRIASGETTLKAQAEQWEKIAGSSRVAAERIKQFSGSYLKEKEAIDILQSGDIGALAKGANSVDIAHIKIGKIFQDQIYNGRTATITGEEFLRQGAKMGYGLALYNDTNNLKAALNTLNGMIAENIRAEEKLLLKQEEDARKAAEKAAEEYDKRAIDAYNLRATFLTQNGGDIAQATEGIARAFGLSGKELTALLARGTELVETDRWREEQRFSKIEKDRAQAEKDKEKQRKEEEERKKKEEEQRKKEAARRLRDDLKGEQEEQKRIQGEIAYNRKPMEWAFTSGGGALHGLNYAFAQAKDPSIAELKKLHHDLEKVEARIKELNTAITGE